MLEEPILMQHQNGALNCDRYAQLEFQKLKELYKLDYAIETGTCLGYTTEFLAKTFNVVRTIEINTKFLGIAKENRLNNYKNCKLYLGDSSKLLHLLLNGLNNKTFIFLDAHWGNHCPLKQELKQIANSGIKPVIAIHDFYVPERPELGYDSINGQPFTFEWLKEGIDDIYGANNYKHYYNDKSMGAKRGIIYITPKNY